MRSVTYRQAIRPDRDVLLIVEDGPENGLEVVMQEKGGDGRISCQMLIELDREMGEDLIRALIGWREG